MSVPAADGSNPWDLHLGVDWQPPDPPNELPHPLRMWDYMVGGKDNYQVDRDAADLAIKYVPNVVFAARAGEAFIIRAQKLDRPARARHRPVPAPRLLHPETEQPQHQRSRAGRPAGHALRLRHRRPGERRAHEGRAGRPGARRGRGARAVGRFPRAGADPGEPVAARADRPVPAGGTAAARDARLHRRGGPAGAGAGRTQGRRWRPAAWSSWCTCWRARTYRRPSRRCGNPSGTTRSSTRRVRWSESGNWCPTSSSSIPASCRAPHGGRTAGSGRGHAGAMRRRGRGRDRALRQRTSAGSL